MAHVLDLKIPLPIDLPVDDTEVIRVAQQGAVIALWRKGTLTLREAAKALGMSYYDFLELLGELDIPILTEGPDESAVEAVLWELKRDESRNHDCRQ